MLIFFWMPSSLLLVFVSVEITLAKLDWLKTTACIKVQNTLVTQVHCIAKDQQRNSKMFHCIPTLLADKHITDRKYNEDTIFILWKFFTSWRHELNVKLTQVHIGLTWNNACLEGSNTAWGNWKKKEKFIHRNKKCTFWKWNAAIADMFQIWKYKCSL